MDLTYTHPSHPNRSSTPALAPRYTTPVHDSYILRQATPHPHPHPQHEIHGGMQYEEPNQSLGRLLGVDFDHLLAEHIEQYETSKKRWTSCSVDEWKAGADGQ